jgi:8-oxo-dGTP diphosphatase
MDTFSTRHSVSVAGIITDELGRVLLIQRADNGHWEPPGGILELGETIHDGLRREIREETGLDTEPISLTGIYKNMTRGIIALVFRCQPTSGTLAQNTEVAGFRWATPHEVRELLTEAYAIRVIDALSGKQPPLIRQHDGTHLV